MIVSVQQFEALKADASKETIKSRQKCFNDEHAAWLEEQNKRFEKSGLWCDDLRVW